MSNCVPIILLASERSGTNLLRVMVSSHSKVSSPPPAGIVGALAYRVYNYLSPFNPAHEKELIEDAITFTKIHLNPWEININPQDVRKRLSSVSFWQIFKSLNDIYAEEEGNAFWFSKEPDLFNYIYEIKMHMPDSKFIYMMRDGRDVAASILKGGVHTNHIYHAAHIWSANQKTCLNALSDPLLSDSMFVLKYEDLITDAKIVLQELMEFVGLNFEPSQLEYYKNKDVINHSNKSEFWKNIAKPLNSSNSGKYKDTLNVKQIEIFESVAWDEMRALGYPLENKIRKEYSVFERWGFKISNVVRKKLKRQDKGKETKQQKEREVRFKKVINRSFYD